MYNLIKSLIMLAVAGTLQACAAFADTPRYHPKGETANLIIDVEPAYKSSLVLMAIDNNNHSFFPNETLLYQGAKSSERQTSHLKVSANQPLNLSVQYDLSSDEFCDLHVKFMPEANHNYRLTAGVKKKKNVSLLYYLAYAGHTDQCFVNVI